MPDNFINLDLPDWYEDKYYTPTQETLFGTGSDLLKGIMPDYFKPIGEFGGNEFQKMLDSLVRDTTRSVEESAAARGIGRSGPANTAVAKAVSDVAAPLRYADYNRAMDKRMNLFKTGADIVGGVRSGGLTYQGQKNQFELERSSLVLRAQMANAELALESDSLGYTAEGSFWGDLLGTGVGLVADYYTGGMYSGAKALGSSNVIDSVGGDYGSYIGDFGKNFWD